MIAFASPLAQYRAHEGAIQEAIARVLASGSYVLGEELERFERAFAAYCDTTHAVGVGSGTDALILALRALDIGPGDEVVTVSHTAVATVAAILATGATPVLVDVDAVRYTVDPAAIEGALTSRTRAIVPVHLYGQAADMDAIIAVARRHGLRVIEDCAQAAGARHRGRSVGSLGDIGCFSFYPTKNLGALGDGGAVVTRDRAVAERVARLRQYGWDATRKAREIGVNSRLDPLQAAVLGAKLPALDRDNARRGALARRYDAGLAGLPVTPPAVCDGASHVYHLYVIACEERDALMAHLRACGIGCAVHYPEPVHVQDGYAQRVAVSAGGLPATEQLVRRILTLPLYPELAETDVDFVIASIRDFYGYR